MNCLKNEKIIIYRGAGSNLTEGMVRMLASEDSFTCPVNFGNHGEFAMIEPASEILDITGLKSKLVYLALPKDDLNPAAA